MHNVTNWTTTDDGTATFENFCSWKLSNFFFRSPSYMPTHEGEDFKKQQSAIRKTIKQMIKKINKGSGWTIIGWHRRGTKSTADEAEEVLANKTAGHISCLMSTDLADLANCTKYPAPAPAQAATDKGAPNQANADTDTLNQTEAHN